VPAAGASAPHARVLGPAPATSRVPHAAQLASAPPPSPAQYAVSEASAPRSQTLARIRDLEASLATARREREAMEASIRGLKDTLAVR
jgi:hypothetical protein